MSKLFYNFRTTTLFIQLFFGEGIVRKNAFVVAQFITPRTFTLEYCMQLELSESQHILSMGYTV